MIECYAKIVNNQITEVSSGIGTSGTWIKIEGYEGEDQTMTYDVSTNTVKIEDKVDEKPVATIEELDTVQLELDKDYVRGKRNSLLSESDWIVTKSLETGVGISTDWKTYRQALRDLPANTTDWANPPWPTEPS